MRNVQFVSAPNLGGTAIRILLNVTLARVPLRATQSDDTTTQP